MDLSALRNILLDLTGTVEFDRSRLAALGSADWQQLAQFAAEQRLAPLLHIERGSDEDIPAAIREGWKLEHRHWTLRSMAQHRDLVSIAGRMRALGIDMLALKGGWLAWHCYPDPAMRPLRDLDLLVPPDRVLEVFAALREDGCEMVAAPEFPLEQQVAADKSLPLLVTPHGTLIDLHHHAWSQQGWLEWPSPAPDDEGLMARAQLSADGVRSPCPHDMIKHLVIHAVYGHLLDCGPLLLSDIDYLLRRHGVDWPGFWRQAEAEGWEPGAALVLALVDRWRAPPALRGALAGHEPPADLMQAAPALLVQNFETRKSAALAASVLGGGGTGEVARRLLLRLRGRRQLAGDSTPIMRDFSAEGGFLAWALSRLKRSIGELSDPAVRQQARNSALLRRFIEGGRG